MGAPEPLQRVLPRERGPLHEQPPAAQPLQRMWPSGTPTAPGGKTQARMRCVSPRDHCSSNCEKPPQAQHSLRHPAGFAEDSERAGPGPGSESLRARTNLAYAKHP